MTSEFGGERRRRRIIVIIAVALAIVAALGTYSLATRPGGGGPAASSALRTVVVAATEIKARTQITQEMLTTASVPDVAAFRTAISDPALAIGNVAVIDLVAGQVIQASMYSTGNPEGVQILAPGETVAPDSPVWRAVSVSVPAERAVAALINVGDHVDLIGSVELSIFGPDGQPASPIPGSFESGPSTKITLLDVEVLNAAKDTNLYVVKVDENQAEEIAHIQFLKGAFTFALRPEADARDLNRDLYGTTTDRIVVQYNFPVPEVLIIPFGASPPPLASPAPSASLAPGETLAPTPTP
jgi:Flp pilus assembly protein CpaB